MTSQAIAAGIDLGGTKAEVQLFDANWGVIARQRAATPKSYDDLLSLIAEQASWAREQASHDLPVGLGSAGIVQSDGRFLAANLVASGEHFSADLERVVGGKITLLNDSRAFALSEAVLGAGRAYDTVLAVIMGTGVGGGVVTNGHLRADISGTAGEFGHAAAPAAVIAKHELPIFDCGCGRVGCVETYISGPSLTRLAKVFLNRLLTPPAISEGKASDPDITKLWALWCEITAEMLLGLVTSVDPDVIILGGGLSNIPGVADDLNAALEAAQIQGFGTPPIILAQSGASSGARGAALAAYQANGVTNA